MTGSKVVQITNIAPQATRDQMQTLFGYLGKIDDIRLYPTIRDVACPVQSRICYVKFQDPSCVCVAQHLTNTVFIDRALIVVPYQCIEIPDEQRALELTNNGTTVPGLFPTEPKLPPNVINQIEGMHPNQIVTTHDPRLIASGLPLYPPLPASMDARRIEEVRRTLLVGNLDDSVSALHLIDFFSEVVEVKYVKFCARDADPLGKYCLVELTDQHNIITAFQLHGKELSGRPVLIYHSTQAISKPQAKSNEAAQREIEEAMSRVKEAQNLISAAIDPVIGLLSKEKKRSRSRSRRSRSPSHGSRRSRRSRSRSRRGSRRSRSRGSRSKRSRSKSREPRKVKDRSPGHSSRSIRSRSSSRRRSRSRSRRSHSKSKSKSSSSRSHDKSKRDRDDKRDRKDDKKDDKKKDDKDDKKEKEEKKESAKESEGDAKPETDAVSSEEKTPSKDKDVEKSKDRDKDEKSKDKDSERSKDKRSKDSSRDKEKDKSHKSSKSSRDKSRSRSPHKSSRHRSPAHKKSHDSRRKSKSPPSSHHSKRSPSKRSESSKKDDKKRDKEVEKERRKREKKEEKEVEKVEKVSKVPRNYDEEEEGFDTADPDQKVEVQEEVEVRDEANEGGNEDVQGDSTGSRSDGDGDYIEHNVSDGQAEPDEKEQDMEISTP